MASPDKQISRKKKKKKRGKTKTSPQHKPPPRPEFDSVKTNESLTFGRCELWNTTSGNQERRTTGDGPPGYMVDKERQRRNDRGEATGGNGTARVWVFLGGVGRLLHHHLPPSLPGLPLLRLSSSFSISLPQLPPPTRFRSGSYPQPPCL